MKNYLRYCVLLLICFSLINCSFLNKKHEQSKVFVDVIIDNKTKDTLYTGELASYSLHYGEHKKVYYLVRSIDVDTTKYSVDCWINTYIFDNEIPAYSSIKLKVAFSTFPINTERKYFEKHSDNIGSIESNPYEENQIMFFIYYTKESINIQYYTNYVNLIKEKGYPLYGTYKNGTIYFIIDYEAS